MVRCGRLAPDNAVALLRKAHSLHAEVSDGGVNYGETIIALA
jgi:hypothetical protein